MFTNFLLILLVSPFLSGGNAALVDPSTYPVDPYTVPQSPSTTGPAFR